MEIIIIINSLYSKPWQTHGQNKVHNFIQSKYTILEETVIDYEYVFYWDRLEFKSKIVLIMKFLSELACAGGIWILWRRFRKLYGWDFDGGISGAKTWLGFITIWSKRRVSAVVTISERDDWSGGKYFFLTNLVTTASSWLLSPRYKTPTILTGNAHIQCTHALGYIITSFH